MPLWSRCLSGALAIISLGGRHPVIRPRRRWVRRSHRRPIAFGVLSAVMAVIGLWVVGLPLSLTGEEHAWFDPVLVDAANPDTADETVVARDRRLRRLALDKPSPQDPERSHPLVTVESGRMGDGSSPTTSETATAFVDPLGPIRPGTDPVLDRSVGHSTSVANMGRGGAGPKALDETLIADVGRALIPSGSPRHPGGSEMGGAPDGRSGAPTAPAPSAGGGSRPSALQESGKRPGADDPFGSLPSTTDPDGPLEGTDLPASQVPATSIPVIGSIAIPLAGLVLSLVLRCPGARSLRRVDQHGARCRKS